MHVLAYLIMLKKSINELPYNHVFWLENEKIRTVKLQEFIE